MREPPPAITKVTPRGAVSSAIQRFSLSDPERIEGGKMLVDSASDPAWGNGLPGFRVEAPLAIAIWKCCKSRSKLLCMRTGTLMHTARWHILLGVVSCLLAILPFGYAQSITDLKSKAEDGDVQAQLALAKAYHLGEGVTKDEAEAVQWWEKAAEHGDVAAQVNL